MGLLSSSDLRKIRDEALAAGLAIKRQQLFFGFEAPVVAGLTKSGVDAAEQLASDLTALNNNEEPSVQGYFLAMWLANAQSAIAATHSVTAASLLAFQKQVEAIPAQAPSLNRDTATSVVKDIQAEASGSAAVQAQVEVMRSYIDELAQRANDLMISKRLHDRLHVTQLGLPIFRSTVGLTGVPEALWKPIARQQARGFADNAAGMAGELGGLAAGNELATMGGDMVTRLQAKIAAIQTGLEGEGPVALMSALLELRAEVRQQMEDLAARVEVDVRSLQLAVLIRNFEAIRALVAKPEEDDLGRQLGGAIGSLTIILQDLSSLNTQHRAWQNLDSLLWWTEDFFYSLGEGDFARRNFELNWRRLSEIIAKLAGEPPPPWYEKNKASEARFLQSCPLPIALPLDGKAAQLFEDFIGETRQVFYQVDVQLKASCDRLGAITRQLKDL